MSYILGGVLWNDDGTMACKPLEALEKLRQNSKDDTHLFDDELLDVIENSLKGLERAKELCLKHDIHDTAELDNTLTAYEILKKDFESMRDFKYKQLDALEIIKNKHLITFQDDATAKYVGIAKSPLTREEYDLLREVLK